MSPSPIHFTRRALCAGAAVCVGTTPAMALETVHIRDLWGDRGAFSPLAERLAGMSVEMRGYMAPPLKPEIDFFVLTRIPMAVCPFCDTEAAWPDDLILVKTSGPLRARDFNDLISVRGQLELGTATEADTGFVRY